MRVFYDPDRDLIFVENTRAVWPSRSLDAVMTSTSITIVMAGSGAVVAGPLQPSDIQRADGTAFTDLASAAYYLGGEFHKIRPTGRTEDIAVIATGGPQFIPISTPNSGVSAMFINGLRQSRSCFAVSGTGVVTPDDIVAGDLVTVVYFIS